MVPARADIAEHQPQEQGGTDGPGDRGFGPFHTAALRVGGRIASWP